MNFSRKKKKKRRKKKIMLDSRLVLLNVIYDGVVKKLNKVTVPGVVFLYSLVILRLLNSLMLALLFLSIG